MASQTLNWNSETESESELCCANSTNEPPKKKRKVCDWVHRKTCKSKEEATNYVKAKHDWVYHNKYKSEVEEVIRYACKKSISCSSRWRIILRTDSVESIVEQSDSEHDHEIKLDRGTVFIHCLLFISLQQT
jgi:hypothetical protein